MYTLYEVIPQIPPTPTIMTSSVNKYTDLKELTPEVLRVFIAKVVIHERDCKWSKTAEQQIDIYFRYIGKLTAEPSIQAE